MSSIQITNSLSAEDELYIKLRWQKLAENYQISADASAELFRLIQFEYSDWSRAYHNMSHLWSLLKLRELYEAELEQPALMDFAIFYHDYIYKAQEKNNEQQSAEWAESFLKKYLSSDDLNYVIELILSTIQHKPRLKNRSDQLWFLDFDLAVLAAPQDVYKTYAKCIRKEYKNWFSIFTYNIGRINVLKNFLKRKALYYTKKFKEDYETIARQNLANEIKSLKII